MTPRNLLAAAAALPTDATATPTDALAVALAREFAWTRRCLASLDHEVRLAIAYHAQKGGQHAGVPMLAAASLGALLVLKRELRDAMSGAPSTVDLGALTEAGDLS